MSVNVALQVIDGLYLGNIRGKTNVFHFSVNVCVCVVGGGFWYPAVFS